MGQPCLRGREAAHDLEILLAQLKRGIGPQVDDALQLVERQWQRLLHCPPRIDEAAVAPVGPARPVAPVPLVEPDGSTPAAKSALRSEPSRTAREFTAPVFSFAAVTAPMRSWGLPGPSSPAA